MWTVTKPQYRSMEQCGTELRAETSTNEGKLSKTCPARANIAVPPRPTPPEEMVVHTCDPAAGSDSAAGEAPSAAAAPPAPAPTVALPHSARACRRWIGLSCKVGAGAPLRCNIFADNTDEAGAWSSSAAAAAAAAATPVCWAPPVPPPTSLPVVAPPSNGPEVLLGGIRVVVSWGTMPCGTRNLKHGSPGGARGGNLRSTRAGAASIWPVKTSSMVSSSKTAMRQESDAKQHDGTTSIAPLPLEALLPRRTNCRKRTQA
mmetsp:Transcript_84142/g.219025  ORF Transcript_84142/g.219025 Transcript_84142/m.219025 type:complete len:260 (-) Transcript_84142:46-825(-)